MNLYSTTLLIDNKEISYKVFKEGDRLFYKPSTIVKGVAAPIFWVSIIDGEWKPINITDEGFMKQIQEDILKHYSQSSNSG